LKLHGWCLDNDFLRLAPAHTPNLDTIGKNHKKYMVDPKSEQGEKLSEKKGNLLIKDGLVVFPGKFTRKASLLIENGKISHIAINSDTLKADQVINAEGKVVFPGIIDSHFHVGIYKPLSEDAKSESKSAIAGGVTTILSYFRAGKNYLNKNEPYTKLFEEVIRLSQGNFYCDYGYNLAPITSVHIEEIPFLTKEWGVTTYKYYMFYKGLNLKSEVRRGSVEKEYLLSDEPYDLGHLFKIMKKISELNKNDKKVRLSIHAEDAELIRIHLEDVKKKMNELNLNPLQAYNMARPPIAERMAIIEAFELASQTGCPINILHITSKLALQTIKELKRYYPDVDCKTEVTAAHLTLTTESNAGVLGKVNPPIRTADDKEALWHGILSNEIFTVVSDHAGITKAMKGSELWSAENGFGATELLLPALLTEGYYKRGISLEKIAELLTTNPAKLHNLSNRKGDISIGLDGDFVIVNLNKERLVRADKLHSAQDFTPFEGLTLKGWPELTILKGNVVFQDNDITSKPNGEYLKRF